MMMMMMIMMTPQPPLKKRSADFIAINLNVIWEEPHRHPSRREWTLLLYELLAVQCTL